MILEKIKKYDLKINDFIKYTGLSRNRFNWVIKKNDPIYIKGLEVKLQEFLHYKIYQLQRALQELQKALKD
tara:strand:+ start:482 stop:694 length:213 start_codon:yes stop_codon:yes gene_type:complete